MRVDVGRQNRAPHDPYRELIQDNAGRQCYESLMKRSLPLGLAFLLACSSDATETADGGALDGAVTQDASADGGASDATPGPFVLSSPVLAEGATFARDNTCDGTDVSPELTWSAGPAGTKSYALVLTDKSNALIHAAAYDIPASSQGLPANVEKKYDPATPAGMKQAQSFRNAFGYAGPCPGTEHTYEFALYALDVDALPGATMTSTRAQVETLAKAHQLGVARLTGKYKKL